MSALTPSQVQRLDVGVQSWEDNGGPILNHLVPVVAALIAEAVDQARAEERAALDRVNTLANLYDEAGRTRTVRTSWADIANEIRSAARITRSQP